MINWIKEKLGITVLEQKVIFLNAKVSEVEHDNQILLNELKQFNRADADVGMYERSNNTIILTGYFRGRPYIQFYDIGDGEFESLVRHMKDMKKHSLIRVVDTPIEMPRQFLSF